VVYKLLPTFNQPNSGKNLLT